ncbi:MAG: N-acetylmuramic acid 6-phosphate etherase [Acidobacteria bacterium]|nr:N-acetylmuramic acid 6-phosphate etherase [Acidobacteriota bacterium]
MSRELPDQQLGKLRTEAANAASAALDERSTLEVVKIIHAEDSKVAAAIAPALPEIAQAVDLIANALEHGGRLIYVGAGTAGRIAALDAAECPPTFNTTAEQVQYVVAGGEKSLGRAREGSEDSRAAGVKDIKRKNPTKRDVVVGVSASGRTPYTLAAVRYARGAGAKIVSVTCNRGTELEKFADIAIVAEVGPEVIAGSTRMKAGTAQKIILNMLSSAAMVRLGKVYGNLMVNVHPKNSKLLERGIRILQSAAGVDRRMALLTLRKIRSVPQALVMLKAGVSASEARRRLGATGGHVRRAIEMKVSRS